MSKASEEIKELQRILGRLARLDGRVVTTATGPVMVWPMVCRTVWPTRGDARRAQEPEEAGPDPGAIIDACRTHGAPTLAALTEGLAHERPPERLDAGTLARAQRDLRRLRAARGWLRTVRQAPRLFSSFGDLDADWPHRRQMDLDRCARALRAADSAPTGPGAGRETPWFAAILDLVEALRGQRARAQLVRLLHRSEGIGERQRQRARRALVALCAELVQPDTTDEQARAIAALWRHPSRRMLRRMYSVVARALGLPTGTGHKSELANSPEIWRKGMHLVDVVEHIGATLLDRIEGTRSPNYRETLRSVLAHYGLLFSAERTPALTPAQIAALAEQRAASQSLIGLNLTIAQVAALLNMTSGHKGRHNLIDIRAVLGAGLSPTMVVRAGELKVLREARWLVDTPDQMRAYCEWMARLLPHYRDQGIELELSADHFRSLYLVAGSDKSRNLAILAHCLAVHHQRTSAATIAADIDRQVAQLDATLGLFQRAPAMAGELTAAVTGTTRGLGVSIEPDFARWLDADHLLDRYLHLHAVLDEQTQLSRALLKDYQRDQRLAREQRFLADLSAPTEHQRRRLEMLAQAEKATPERTRRWLATRIPELAARAYRHKLNQLMRQLVREICGLRTPTLTRQWRDAVRFFLTTDDNRELLRQLLRFAAVHPGESYRAVGEANRTWLERAGEHMDVSAWLAPRQVTVTLDGERYTLALESDPLHILRMGIPFGTCLALATGENAAATVINAMDANKQVMYLRDGRGIIVGRKLCAVSTNWQLVGYQAYSALNARTRTQVRTACDQLCRQLADECGLDLAVSGKPEQLHEGFWYDDGTQPFAVEASDGDAIVAAYCAALGRPTPGATPSASCTALVREARAYDARQRADVSAALDCLDRQFSPANRQLGEFIIAELGLAEATRRARTNERLVEHLLRHIERQSGTERAILVGSEFAAISWSVSADIRSIVDRAPPSPALAEALIRAAQRWRETSEYDDHGLEHQTMWIAPGLLEVVNIDRFLALVDRLQPLWDVVVAEDAGCRDCRASAEMRLFASALRSYAASPEPAAVVQCLSGRRRTLLARRVAVHIAARFTLDARARGPLPAMDLAARYDQKPHPAPAVVRALKRLAGEYPQLRGEPDLYAAAIRHSPRDALAGQASRASTSDFMGKLPRPDRAPFAALGPLLAHLPGLSEHLRPWADPGIPAKEWSGHAWELYFHRHRDTPWRATLRAALDREDSRIMAARCLALLGDVEAVVACRARLNPQARALLDPSVRVAHAVSALLQMAGPDSPGAGVDNLRARLPTTLPEVEFDRLADSHFVTRPVLRAAWRELHDAADGSLAGPGSSRDERLEWALEILWHGAEPAQIDEFLSHALDHLDRQPVPIVKFIGRFLAVRTTYGAPQLKRAWVARLWNCLPLRDDLLIALARTDEHDLDDDLEVVERAAPDTPTEGLYAAWLAALLSGSRDFQVSPGRPELARKLARELLAPLAPADWVKVYLNLPDCASASAFLDGVADAPELPAIQRAAPSVKTPDWDHLAPILREWLAALERRPV